MLRKIGFAAIWIGFVIYAFFFAPPQQPGTFELIKDLSLGNWEGIHPLIITLFMLMGIWPAIYACVLFIDGRGQKIWAWPFSIVSFAVGAFAILPYLILRQPNPQWTGEKNFFLKLLDSRLTGIFLTVGTIIILYLGLSALSRGDGQDFIQQWRTSKFIHVMSLDFYLLCLLFPALLKDDLARRGIKKNSLLFWGVILIPLFGPLAYLSLRPPLPENSLADQLAVNNS